LKDQFGDDAGGDGEVPIPLAYLESWTPYRQIESTRVVAAVRKATAHIPAWLMDVFERHYVHDESVRGLAKETGMCEKALASRLRRVRVKLQSMLAAYNPKASKVLQRCHYSSEGAKK
jgi:DNA-directed RNA polymerase specialized sigma24 family protein